MRTRTRSSILLSRLAYAAKPFTVNSIDCPTGAASSAVVNVAGGYYEISSERSRITDTTGRGKSNPCSHRRVVRAGNTNSENMRLWNGVTNKVDTYIGKQDYIEYYLSVGLGHVNGWDINHASSVPPRYVHDYSDINEVSLKNDVIEAADQLKADILLNIVESNKMWPSIRRLALSMPAMAKNWNSLRRVITTASASYLFYKFGVSPILSDIMRVQRHLPVMVNDLKRHVEGDTMRFSKSAVAHVSFDDAEYTEGNAYRSVQRRWTYHPERGIDPTVRYVLAVKPNVQYGPAIFKNAGYALDRFATSPATLAWELVPFSFVLDWFVDLRATLRAVDRSLGYKPYQVVGFTRSLLYSHRTRVLLRVYNDCNSAIATGPYDCGTVDCRHYERSPVVNWGFLPTWSPRFGKNQAAISAALLSRQISYCLGL